MDQVYEKCHGDCCMRTVRLKIYKFDELSNKAKETALLEAIEFTINNCHKGTDPLFRKACELENEMDKMRTPWFLQEAIYSNCLSELIEFCRKYEYYESGRVFCGEL